MPAILRRSDPPLEIYLALSALVYVLTKPDADGPSVLERVSNISLGSETTLVKERDSFTVVSSDQDSSDIFEDDSTSFLAANNICCTIVFVYKITQILVFGTLRVSEKNILKDTFWDYFLHKGLIVFSILDTETYEERLPWAVWSTAFGFILILAQLCRNRFDYLSSSPTTKKWYLIKIYILMGLLLATTILCGAIITMNSFTTSTLFLLSDITYLFIYLTAVIFRFLILTYDMRTDNVWENRNSVIYYSDLFFTMAMFSIEFLHNMYLVIVSFTALAIKFWCIMKITAMVEEIRKRYKKHKNYLDVIQLVELSFPVATKEELEQNRDDCAICWDEMVNARKLPCGHLFHCVCLRSWLEQDASCPTCRKYVKAQQSEMEELVAQHADIEEEFVEVPGIRAAPRSNFFHFDSSRYTNHPFLSWLPTIPVEGFV